MRLDYKHVAISATIGVAFILVVLPVVILLAQVAALAVIPSSPDVEVASWYEGAALLLAWVGFEHLCYLITWLLALLTSSAAHVLIAGSDRRQSPLGPAVGGGVLSALLLHAACSLPCCGFPASLLWVVGVVVGVQGEPAPLAAALCFCACAVATAWIAAGVGFVGAVGTRAAMKLVERLTGLGTGGAQR